jgi:putative coproporphyrinogen dehydrogenase
VPKDFVGLLQRELEQVLPLQNASIRTIYFGGGTPSMLAPTEVGSILHTIREFADLERNLEVTLEANPEHIDSQYVEGLLMVGVNRLSLGLQSLNDSTLQFLGRRHTAEHSMAAVHAAKTAGMPRICVDMMFGIPGESLCELERSLEGYLALNVGHISAYHLSYEEGTPFGHRVEKQNIAPIDDALSEAHYLLVHRKLTGAGYEHYEVSNYALPGQQSRHNTSYWLGYPYVGIGPAAHSYDGQYRRWWNPASYARWVAQVEKGESAAGSEELTAQELMEEWVMLGLRTAWGLDLDEGLRRFGAVAIQAILKHATPLIAAGYLISEGQQLRIPPERFLQSDWVIRQLLG